jgi:hypothetical protein
MSPQLKDTLIALTGFILGVASVGVVALSWVDYYRRFRQQGYRGNVAFLFVGGSCTAGFAIAVALVSWLSHGPLVDMDGGEAAVSGCVCVAVCAVTFMHVLLRVIPVPKTRSMRGGWRNGWFYGACALALIGILCFGAGLISLIRRDLGSVLLILLATVYFVLAYKILRRARASRQINDALKSDKRRPVLYLRGFKDEALPFDKLAGRDPWWGIIRGDLRGKALFPWVPHYGPKNLELYITDAVERKMGPFIALGNPDDFFAPVGAAREYHGPDWRKEFEGMVGKCIAVLVLPGSARELDWEMGWLLESGNAAKLFLLFGRWAYGYPVTQGEKLLKSFIPPRWMRLFESPRPEPLLWPRYRDAMNALGYTLPVDAPSASTVMGFSTMGRGIVIISGCGVPEDYVNAIVTYLVKQAAQQKPKRAIITPIPTSSS